MSTTPTGLLPPQGTNPPNQPPDPNPPGNMAPQPPGPTFPAVYYSYKGIVPPVVVQNQQMLDRLNNTQPGEWDTVPPQDPQAAKAKDDYPKLMYNVNIVPQVVNSADEEAKLGNEWQVYQFTQSLVTAAQKQVQAAQAAAAKKAAAAQAQQGQQTQPGYQYPPGYYPQYGYQQPGYGYPPQYPPPTGD